jgi:hypothetical protein
VVVRVDSEFSQAALTLLREAGWYPKRHVDEEPIMRDLRDIGFGESQSAATFLREFGLLKIDHQPSLTIRGKLVASSTAFDPLRVCTERDVTVASRCSEIVGAKLFPIGVDSFHMTIYMADNLSLYASLV